VRSFPIAALLTTSAVVLVGCSVESSNKDGARPPVRPESTVREILSRLNCDSVRVIAEDITRFAHSAGVDCSVGTSGTFVRAYEKASVATRAAADWQPLGNASRPLILGGSWLAIGPRAEVSALADAPGTRTILSAKDFVHVQPVGAREADRDACVQFVASGFRDKMVDSSAFKSEIQALEALYPGVQEVLAKAVRREDIERAASLKDKDDNSMEAFLSTFGPRIKKFCASIGDTK
jgi:hypothetical protein